MLREQKRRWKIENINWYWRKQGEKGRSGECGGEEKMQRKATETNVWKIPKLWWSMWSHCAKPLKTSKDGRGDVRWLRGHSSCRGPEFWSWHPDQETHSCLEFQTQRLQQPRQPSLSTNSHGLTSTQIHMHTHDFQSFFFLNKSWKLLKRGGGGPMHIYLVFSPESQHLHSSHNTTMQGLCPAPASLISDWCHSCYEFIMAKNDHFKYLCLQSTAAACSHYSVQLFPWKC